MYLEQGQAQGLNGSARSWVPSAAGPGGAAGARAPGPTSAAAAALEPLSERWKDVARLLSRKHDRIDPTHALSLLPDGVRPKANRRTVELLSRKQGRIDPTTLCHCCTTAALHDGPRELVYEPKHASKQNM